MISKQRGIIDPWTLGFLISLTGLTITQTKDSRHDDLANESFNKVKTSVVNIAKTHQDKILNNI